MDGSKSIQSLEMTDVEKYEHVPDDLFEIGKKLYIVEHNEKALEILEAAIKYKLAQLDSNETHPEMAKFYYYYGITLLDICQANNEIMNNAPGQGEEEEEEDEEDNLDDVGIV